MSFMESSRPLLGGEFASDTKSSLSYLDDLNFLGEPTGSEPNRLIKFFCSMTGAFEETLEFWRLLRWDKLGYKLLVPDTSSFGIREIVTSLRPRRLPSFTGACDVVMLRSILGGDKG